MCGIVGFVRREADRQVGEPAPNLWEILLTGLRRLEYRGYDSWGVVGLPVAYTKKQRHTNGAAEALANTGNGKKSGRANGHAADASSPIILFREVGRITKSGIPEDVERIPISVGIAHTRWATHGAPSIPNAHPHLDRTDTVAIAHNGIIENDVELKRYLKQKGVTSFRSETDTEVLTQLISLFDRGDLAEAVRDALAMVEGTYGLAVMSSRHPHTLIGARKGSPLLVGEGPEGVMIASDPNAMIATGGRFIPLEDGEMAILTPEGFHIERLDDKTSIEREIEQIELLEDTLHHGGFETFMAKEIHEQPQAIANCLRGRLDIDNASVRLGGVNIDPKEARALQHVILLGCGTSWHAALVARLLIEELAGIPCSVDYSAEFRYRNPVLHPNTLVVAISQSGETADTLAGVEEAKRRGASVVGICNVVGSTIARECGRGIYIHAGPEIGVASTKAFTCQLTALALLAIHLGKHRNLSDRQAGAYVKALAAIPDQVASILKETERIKQLAIELSGHSNFLYIGRGAQFPVALEGALKLKEISYRHAEGIPAAELKHGPIALIDENMPVVVLAPEGRILSKMRSNIQEIKARKGRLLGIVTKDNNSLDDLLDWRLDVPGTMELIEPILTVIPLQLLAHDMAHYLGKDVDRPRNLAKSVTVE